MQHNLLRRITGVSGRFCVALQSLRILASAKSPSLYTHRERLPHGSRNAQRVPSYFCSSVPISAIHPVMFPGFGLIREAGYVCQKLVRGLVFAGGCLYVSEATVEGRRPRPAPNRPP